MSTRSRLPGFYRLPLDERRRVLVDRFALAPLLFDAFDVVGGLDATAADHMVENALGVLGLPVGVALNFVVNGEAVLVPMAIEEPSVIAACSHVARLVGQCGGFTTSSDAPPPLVALNNLSPKMTCDGMARLAGVCP